MVYMSLIAHVNSFMKRLRAAYFFHRQIQGESNDILEMFYFLLAWTSTGKNNNRLEF